MKNSVFVKVRVDDELPEDEFDTCITNYGEMFGGDVNQDTCDWWLKKIDLPSEDELRKESLGGFSEEEADDEEIGEYIEDDAKAFMAGANYILSKLK
jgi:hypothetical protein